MSRKGERTQAVAFEGGCITGPDNQKVAFNVLPSYVIGSTIPVDRNPDGIAYDPVHQRMYVTNTGSDTVFVIDIGSNARTICPQANIQHWDKIVFKVNFPDIAMNANLPVGSELDIKILDNPKEVSYIRKGSWNLYIFLTRPKPDKDLIIGVDHTIICA